MPGKVLLMQSKAFCELQAKATGNSLTDLFNSSSG
jgi:hypothetical protein